MNMTTHEVEEMLSITKKTLIYYENEGLVKPARDSNNYRNYNQEDVSRIKFILLLREMDVTIEEIKQIINDKKSIRDVLENKKDTLSEEDLQMTLYILNESEKLEKELRDKFEDIPIQRPKWNQK